MGSATLIFTRSVDRESADGVRCKLQDGWTPDNGDVSCPSGSLCSSDGKWRASQTTLTLTADNNHKLRNPRFSRWLRRESIPSPRDTGGGCIRCDLKFFRFDPFIALASEWKIVEGGEECRFYQIDVLSTADGEKTSIGTVWTHSKPTQWELCADNIRVESQPEPGKKVIDVYANRTFLVIVSNRINPDTVQTEPTPTEPLQYEIRGQQGSVRLGRTSADNLLRCNRPYAE